MITAALASALLLLGVAALAPSSAAEYNTFSGTVHTWAFRSPSGNTSDEPSGIAASRRNAGYVIWENEAARSGMGMLYAVTSSGLQKTFKFKPSGSMFDFEDMAIGPCDGAGSSRCVWVGDIGRLSADFPASSKNTFWLYRMAEPNIAYTANNTQLTVTGRFGFTLPDTVRNEGKKTGGSTSSYDMEALMVHPGTGDVYLVTKGQNSGGLIRVMKYPRPFSSSTVKKLETVKTFQMPRSPSWNPSTLSGQGYHLVTGGDIHPDGRRFVLRTYGPIWEFRGATFADALRSTSPVSLPNASGALDNQGEAVGYAPDGSHYYTIAEASSTITRYVVYYNKQ